MARPKKQFPPKKKHRITIRMTEDMYFVVAREAERAGLSISDYLRQLVLHHKIVYKPPIIHDDRAIIEELKDINKLGNNLNQIARYLNQGGAMTGENKSAIIIPTNPVRTVAQEKEDTEMRATEKITALYCRLSQEDERQVESLSIENQKMILSRYAKEHHFPNTVYFVESKKECRCRRADTLQCKRNDKSYLYRQAG